MNFVEHINQWIERHRSALERAGTLVVSDSTDTRPKRAVHIAAQEADHFAEIIVWDTGEAEFGFGTMGGMQSDEHHDLIDTVELDHLLTRFLARVEELHQ
jgi:hypothetical protein